MKIKPRHSRTPAKAAAALVEDSIQEEEPAVSISPQDKMLVSLMIDSSASMVHSGAIDQALTGAEALMEQLVNDDMLRYSVELKVSTFNSKLHTIVPYGPLERGDDWQSFDDHRGGGTHTGEAYLEHAADLEQRHEDLSDQGIGVRADIDILLTDGEANGKKAAWSAACRKAEELRRRFPQYRLFGIAVEGADLVKLAELTGQPKKLRDIKAFTELWDWLYRSMRSVSESLPGQATLPSTDPWEARL